MTANRRQQLRFSLLAIFMLTGMIAVRAQTGDCQGTIKAWEADPNMREYAATCTCVGQNTQPTCTANGGGGDARQDARQRRNRGAQPAAAPANPGTGGATIDNSGADNAAAAEAERNRQEEEFKLKQESLKGGLKTGNSGSSVNSGNSAILGLKPSSGVTRDQTVKRIKELNCSAFWAVEALKAVRSLGLMSGEVKLEDEYTQMRQYAEFSAQAKDGKSVEGCPEVKINVPDVPPPLDSNPQIQFYDQLIIDAQNLVPQVIDTNRKMLETGTRLKETETAKKSEARKLKKILSKPNTPANRAEKKKTISKIDELGDLVADLQGDVDALKKKAEEEEAKAKKLQTMFDSGP